MLTIDDVRSIPLFSALAAPELERLAETSADLHLGAGEFAVHEGDDRAPYAVLTGKWRQFLARNQITYDWMTPDAPELSTRWPGMPPADDECPVLRLTDGTLLRRPATRELAERLGLQTRARLPEYDTIIIGGGPAGQAALHFANHARTVTLVVRGDSLEKSMSRYLIEQLRSQSNVTVQPRSEVVAAHGDTHLTAIDIRDGANARVRRHDSGGLFVFIGADAETGWLPAEIARDNQGYVLTGDDAVKAGRWSHDRDPYLLESSAPGIFACGDVRLRPVKRVASAVGEGSMAIAFVHRYLQQDAR